jgi:penicillin amidase
MENHKLDPGRSLHLLEALRGRITLAEAARRAGVSPTVMRRHRARYLESKLPPARQSLETGVERPVRIVRDAGGVPHVYAETARGLFLGQGFAVAQDRLWQLDYLRRRALGRLAEVLGRDALDADRRSRILGFARLAGEEVEALSPEAAEALEGFAAGVNAWMARVCGNLPIEFEILEYEPEPWTPRDSVAIQRALLWQLTGRLENLAAAEVARRVLGDELAAEFLTTESPDETILGPADGPGPGTRVQATGGADAAGGSNNWAVSPARSVTGRALLASDPHLPFSLPAGLHVVRLCGAGYDVAGATFAGGPGVTFGHNGRIAWGITNLVASPRDLYVETLDPHDAGRYRENGGSAPFSIRREEISVRDGPPITIDVRSTVRGPVVDEIVPRLPGSDGTVLSVRWVGQERLGDVQATLDVDRAHDWQSFRRALSGWRLGVYNFVYADADGHIGWQATGSIPVRGEGDRTRGYRPATDPAHAWRGYIPFEALPSVLDPPRGWVGSANNRPVPDDFPQPIYGWWAPGHRAVRIRQFFESRHQFGPDDFHAMQFDTVSVRAAQAVPPLRDRLARAADLRERFLPLLEGWDYRFGPESVAATLFETFFERWWERVIRSRFPAEVQSFLIALGAGSGLALRLIVEGRPEGWFGERSLDAELADVARAALAELTARCGADSTAWRWGAVHQISFKHPLDGRPGTRGLFASPPAEAHGTSHVLNNNGFAHGRRFDVTQGPEFRLVVDLGDLDRAAMTLTTGQSGQPGSPHYLDHLPRWLDGGVVTVPWTRAAVDAAATGEVRLDVSSPPESSGPPRGSTGPGASA